LSLSIEPTITILKSEYDILIASAKRVVELDNLVVELRAEIVSLRAEVKSLKEEIHFLKNGKNSKNSSTPPSHDLARSNGKSLRAAGNKKSGGQKGHEGSTLLMSDSPDKIIEYNEIHYCCLCAHSLENITLELSEKKQEIILPPIQPQYVEHRSFKKTCTHCGHLNRSDLPNHLVSNIQYGNCVQGLLAYMHTYQFLSMNRMADFMKNVFQMPISEGTIDNLLTKFADKTTPIYNTIQERITQSSVIGSDETGSKINAKKGWFHVWQTTKLTFIVASMSRGFSTVEKYFEDGFPFATLVSDCWAGQLKTISKYKQLCIAHLLRELNNFIDALDDGWSKDLKEILEKAIAIKNKSHTTGLAVHANSINELKLSLNKLLEIQDPPKHKKIDAFIKRLRKHRSSILVFLEIEDVPFDNNASERAIRNIKVKTKISGCFRTLKGAERFAKIRSVIDTTIKNSQNVLEALKLLANLSIAE
jgi:transposase